MVYAHRSIDRPPLPVRLVDPIVRRLLRIGFPMGPNTLLTVRGRKSGLPRSAGVALMEIDGRRWVISAYGNVHWTRNLRAAGEAVIRVRGRDERVWAVELSPVQAVAFFRDVLTPHIRAMPPHLRVVSWVFARDILADPEGSAARRPVFELT